MEWNVFHFSIVNVFNYRARSNQPVYGYGKLFVDGRNFFWLSSCFGKIQDYYFVLWNETSKILNLENRRDTINADKYPTHFFYVEVLWILSKVSFQQSPKTKEELLFHANNKLNTYFFWLSSKNFHLNFYFRTICFRRYILWKHEYLHKMVLHLVMPKVFDIICMLYLEVDLWKRGVLLTDVPN